MLLLVPATLLAVLASAGLGLRPALAAAPGQAAAPQQVQIGIYVINLEQLDVRTGNFTAEFFLSFKCTTGACDINDFRIVNGKYTILDKDIVQSADGTQVTYHVRGDLNENLNYSNFPFDQHYLGIRIESADKTLRDLVFVPEDSLSGLDPGLQMAGWTVDGAYQTSVAPQTYKVFADPFSRFTFQFLIDRPDLYGWLKALLPATIIMISGLLAYLFNYDSAGNSIAVVTAALAGSVLFNINLTSVLPATGSLTTADLFMIVNYIALVLTLAVMIGVYVLRERGRDERAKRLFSTARRFVPAGWVIVQAVMLFYTLVLRANA